MRSRPDERVAGRSLRRSAPAGPTGVRRRRSGAASGPQPAVAATCPQLRPARPAGRRQRAIVERVTTRRAPTRPEVGRTRRGPPAPLATRPADGSLRGPDLRGRRGGSGQPGPGRLDAVGAAVAPDGRRACLRPASRAVRARSSRRRPRGQRSASRCWPRPTESSPTRDRSVGSASWRSRTGRCAPRTSQSTPRWRPAPGSPAGHRSGSSSRSAGTARLRSACTGVRSSMACTSIRWRCSTQRRRASCRTGVSAEAAGTLDRLGAATEPDDALAEPGRSSRARSHGPSLRRRRWGGPGESRAEPAGAVIAATEPRAGLPTGAAVVVAALGTMLAATAFVAVRRRRR